MNDTIVGCVNPSSTLMRPKFGPGMLLQADDLDALSTYTRDLNRLLFRSFFGCGVVCGLVVEPGNEDKCGKLAVSIGSGLALDCNGDPIYVPRNQVVTLDDCKKDLGDDLWVLLCATSKCCAPRTSSCGCDDDVPAATPTRVRDGFEIRVVSELPKCACHCVTTDSQPAGEKASANAGAMSMTDDSCPCGPTDGCYESHYKGECDCCDDCTDGSCDCSCVVLAELTRSTDSGEWTANHCARRFIRPIFMRDYQCKAAVDPKTLLKKEANLQALVVEVEKDLKPRTNPKRARKQR